MIAKKHIFFIFTAIMLLFTACEPEYKSVDSFTAPDPNGLSFTVTPDPTNSFKVTVTNTSALKGIVTWNFGNGTKASGETAATEYNMKGDYKITMTVSAKGGMVSTTKTYTQTVDNMALLLNDKVKKMIGAVNDPVGKTWVLASEEKGHFGVGPTEIMDADGTPWKKVADIVAAFSWWTANPFDKNGWECYDDELTFIFADNTFKCIYKNNGKSFGRKEGVATHSALYSNIQHTDDSYDRSFDYPAATNGLNGNWAYSEKDGKSYITFVSEKVIYPMYDINSADNKYRLAYIDDNYMVLVGRDGDDGSARLFTLKKKGYVKPEPTFDVATAAATAENTHTVKLSNVVLPGGATIAKVAVDYGDGSAVETSNDYNNVFTHQFVHKGNYGVNVTVTDGAGKNYVKTAFINVVNNITGYVPYLINEMVMYNDFGETQLVPVKGENCAVEIVSNPDKTKFPNRSSNVMKYTKDKQEWANAFMVLPYGRRFDLANVHTFKILVYGNAGDEVLLKLENTDLGEAWKTGTHDLKYKIKQSNTWEVATFEFAGVGAGFDWTGMQFTSDITKDPKFNTNYYNVIRIMLRPGDASGKFSFYFDDLAGPHVEGLK